VKKVEYRVTIRKCWNQILIDKTYFY